MPYATGWVIDNGIIRTRITQNLSPDCKEAQDEFLNQLLSESERQNTHVILDCSDLYYPTFRNWRWIRNVRLGWLVIYGVENPLMRFALSTAMQIAGVRSQFVANEGEAVAFLQDVDITLPKLHMA